MGRPIAFDREQAIETAMNAFWRKGYEACSVKALSEELGITRSSFYNAFGSREALFDLALQAYAARSPDKALAETSATPPIRPLLTRTFRQICAARARDPERRGCLIVNTVAELGGAGHPVGKQVTGLLLCSIEMIEGLLKRAVAAGELAETTDTATIALALQNLMIGLNLLCKSVPEEERLWAAARATLEGLGVYDDAMLA